MQEVNHLQEAVCKRFQNVTLFADRWNNILNWISISGRPPQHQKYLVSATATAAFTDNPLPSGHFEPVVAFAL